MDWKITLAEPDLGQPELDALTRVIESNWLTMGGVTAQFEKAFAERMKVKHAFAVTNCTAALHLANVALGVTTGDEVLCPALTFVASANATRYTGANVVFVDSKSSLDFTIDPSEIEAKINSKTKAITVVHYAGFACDMEPILALSKKHNLKVIEDCAHAPFAQYRFTDGTTEYVGAMGDVGCFSFFGNKNMTTAEGGMITTNNDQLAEKIRLLRSHGMTTLTYERHKGHASGYDVVDLGFNYRIDELRSALGLAQLEKIDAVHEKRREVYSWYKEALSTKSNVIMPFTEHELALASVHIMPVMIKEGYLEVREKLKEAGIQTSRHYDLVPSFTAYGNQNFPSKIEFIDNIATLPFSQKLTKEDVQLIASYL